MRSNGIELDEVVTSHWVNGAYVNNAGSVFRANNTVDRVAQALANGTAAPLFTFFCWVKPVASGVLFSLESSTGRITLTIEMTATKGAFNWRVDVSNSAEENVFITGVAGDRINRWNFIGFTLNGTSVVALTPDGFGETEDLPSEPFPTAYEFRLMRNYDGDEPLNGQIMSPTICRGALSYTEVVALGMDYTRDPRGTIGPWSGLERVLFSWTAVAVYDDDGGGWYVPGGTPDTPRLDLNGGFGRSYARAEGTNVQENYCFPVYFRDDAVYEVTVLDEVFGILENVHYVAAVAGTVSPGTGVESVKIWSQSDGEAMMVDTQQVQDQTSLAFAITGQTRFLGLKIILTAQDLLTQPVGGMLLIRYTRIR